MTSPDVAAIARGLSPLEADLLCGRCEGWGSWMFSVGQHLVSLGLGTERNGSLYFDTPLAAKVINLLEHPSHD